MRNFQCYPVKVASVKLKIGSAISLILENKERKKIPYVCFEIRFLKRHARTLASGFHNESRFLTFVDIEKSYFLMMKLGGIIDLMIMKN